MFIVFIVIYLILFLFNLTLSSSSNTLVFSAGPNSYVAFDSWRPCLNGYVRFDIRTNAPDGTLAYIDDRGKFDFFYLKLIEGKLRLLFNLGNDRQALNVNMKINDDQWHTILIKRDGQTTILSVDNDLATNSTITHSEDLYFGGSTHNEYQASPFYFGGIPSALERPSSGNLSSFDVYMQPRFRGRLRNIIYKNCTNSHLVQPVHLQISGGVSIIPNQQCSSQSCGIGICLITDTDYKCLCDETDYQGERCEYERKPNELTFNGKKFLHYNLKQSILSLNELIQFQFKTNHYNALLFELINQQIYIKLKQGQIIIEYRYNNQWYESSTKDLYLIDNQWHYVQIKRKYGQISMMVDEYHLQLENDVKIDQLFNITDIYIGGNNDENSEKFYGCLKDILLILNDKTSIDISKYFLTDQSNENQLRCSSLLNPIEFLISSSFISFELPEHVQQMVSYQLNISFHFQTYSSDAIILYGINKFNEDFLGLDLIDGFFYITINMNKKKQRQELFQQRLNDGQTHFIHLHVQGYQGGLEFNITMNYRQNNRIVIRDSLSKIQLHTLTIGGINPSIQWLPNNYWSGIMHRGLIGCFSDLELNNEAINLTKYINYTNNNITPKSGPCSISSALSSSLSKRECSCEHEGECRLNNGGTWSCDCSKTGYTGRQCEHATYHIDLNKIHIFELNTNIQWSEQINDIAFGLQATHDQENFIQFRPCRQTMKCDSIDFSIRNGLLHINFNLSNIAINISGEYSFLLDNQWHYIHLHRIDTKLLLHIDHHIAQQRLNIIETNLSSLSTIWLILNGNKNIRIEDIRLYDQSLNTKFFLNNQYEQIQLKYRPWKPLNSISFYDQQDAYITIQLNDILCQECELDTIYFDFRTTELTGVILYANIQTTNSKIRYSIENNFDRESQYLMIKLVDGQLHLIVVIASLHEDEDEIHQIQTPIRLNDGHWHHISLYRTSDHHLELIIDSREYYLLTSIHFIDTIYFGRPTFLSSDHVNTLKTCLASLTINSRSINLREYIKTNSQIRNDCFLDSQCPLRHCLNTGLCLDRIKCDCQHTSFQGEFCTDLKIGYFFNEYTSGLIFDQPYRTDKKFSNYKISFGIVTKMLTGEIIRISDQIQIELYRGHIRIKLAGNINDDSDFIQNDIMINDGYYHLVQIEYNITGYLSLNVDNKLIVHQLTYQLLFDKPLLLLIGQNAAFRYGFQGQLYGLESDIYSVFDMISPTFQRISYSPIQDKAFSSISPSSSSFSSPTIIYPSMFTLNDLIPSFCSSQSYDDICIVTSDRSTSPILYPNITLLTSLPTNRILSSSLSSARSTSKYTTLYTTSTILSSHIDLSTSISSNYTSNSTQYNDNPPLINSIRTPISSRFRRLFHWQHIWVILVPVLCGSIFCILIAIFGFIKYRRKDVGVYEVEEAQRFRPLIVELTPSPGERNLDNFNSTIRTTSLGTSSATHLSKTDIIKSHKKRRRRKSPLTSNDDQREFYI
ncbi:unnamed protein product [Adineta steineri]|uniref:Uncharacterized protein n=2 Tax=Adineta steineri TaxID=433720 RepID=A0A815DSG3_9BILA|nr:unnamed protein product [Adineta steineri]CAF3578506.1 unnamed protein product [Adineta steineri]